MKIKFKLEKPYTEQERLDFIVQNNHNNGYQIEETENALLAMEYTEEERAEEEKHCIEKLCCSKRNFALMLRELGISYNQLKEYISTNENALLEWDLCERLERSNPLINEMASGLGITSEQIDKMFKYANGMLNSFV